MTPKTGHFFEINRLFVLAFSGLGKGYATVKNVTSIVNLNAPVTSQSLSENIRTMSVVTEELLEQGLKDEALSTTKFSVDAGKRNNKTDLNSETFHIAIGVDGSYKLSWWNLRDGIVDTCFENTGKAIDIIYKTTKCRECSRKKRRLQSGSTEEIDCMEWYVGHKQQCLVNHEGSVQVKNKDLCVTLHFVRPKRKERIPPCPEI